MVVAAAAAAPEAALRAVSAAGPGQARRGGEGRVGRCAVSVPLPGPVHAGGGQNRGGSAGRPGLGATARGKRWRPSVRWRRRGVKGTGGQRASLRWRLRGLHGACPPPRPCVCPHA